MPLTRFIESHRFWGRFAAIVIVLAAAGQVYSLASGEGFVFLAAARLALLAIAVGAALWFARNRAAA